VKEIDFTGEDLGKRLESGKLRLVTESATGWGMDRGFPVGKMRDLTARAESEEKVVTMASHGARSLKAEGEQVGAVEAAADAQDVGADGLFRDAETGGGFLDAEAGFQAIEHLLLLGRQLLSGRAFAFELAGAGLQGLAEGLVDGDAFGARDPFQALEGSGFEWDHGSRGWCAFR